MDFRPYSLHSIQSHTQARHNCFPCSNGLTQYASFHREAVHLINDLPLHWKDDPSDQESCVLMEMDTDLPQAYAHHDLLQAKLHPNQADD